jgi:hypothetical protein
MARTPPFGETPRLRALPSAPKASHRIDAAPGRPRNSVERETQLAVLRNLACDTAQGYLVSRPVPAEQIS